MELDFERCYRAVDSRDQRFDGWFYTGVTSTGIYCRPSCPAMTPKRRNVRFFPSSAAAQRAGLRACRRCRPDASPGSPQWDVRADVVGRAMRLIADGVVDRDGVPGLAARLGYTERHLHRMLRAELGAGPLALARAQRAQTARTLIETTGLGLAEIAFAAGFGSVRQFNDTVRAVYGAPPSQLRTGNGAPVGGAGPCGWRTGRRCTPPRCWTSSPGARCPGSTRWSTGRTGGGCGCPTDHVAATLRLADLRDLAPAVARCRRLFDLDADPVAVDQTLAADPALAAPVAAEPGVRVPRAVDGFEMAVRAIATQQVSLASARTTLIHLLDHTGTVDQGVSVPESVSGRREVLGRPDGSLRGFATAAEVLGVPDSGFRMPGGRRETIRAVARAVAAGELDLEPGGDREETVRRLTAIPGVGAWTAGYLAMRALGDPDTFLPTDLAVRRGAAALGLTDNPKTLDEYAGRWRPWRSYAVIRLWRSA